MITENITKMQNKTQADKLTILKTKITAVYFIGNQRILTYGSIDLLTASIELIRLQKRDNAIITMLIIDNENFAETTSWDIEDYRKYVIKEAEN